jgi:hypothetical protein
MIKPSVLRALETRTRAALTNRKMERLFPGGNVKTFLTRSGRREVVGVK